MKCRNYGGKNNNKCMSKYMAFCPLYNNWVNIVLLNVCDFGSGNKKRSFFFEYCLMIPFALPGNQSPESLLIIR